MRLPLLVAALSSLALLPACASDPERGPPHPRPMMMAISPAGERLGLPGRPAAEALAAWFKAADANSDGRLDTAELQADAARFFKTLDADGDGAVNSRELEEARRQQRDALRRVAAAPPDGTLPEGAPVDDAPGDRDGEKADGSRPRGRGPGDAPGGVMGGGMGGGVDPVMSADRNLDFRVTLIEMQQDVLRRMQEMDGNQDGSVDLAEVEAWSRAAAARAPGGGRHGGGPGGGPGGPGGGRGGGRGGF
ncbi:hypothetical protein [Oleisolibacter albus]|uniref:hypothetical protein n=1 Tax=Oleisolibacter albus TaxID=2171757 RepID=UPI000DF35790|nr:hypothetical protein [Oleisolibacter albus]